jgi:hypothetical protein
MDDTERARIVAETLRNIDPAKRKQEQEELVQRLMAQPGEDKVAKWKAEAAETRAARERSRAEIASVKTPDWSLVDERIQAAVHSAIQQERAFIFAVVGEVLGELSAEQYAKDRQALNRETEKLWSVLREIQKTIANLNKVDRHVPIEDVLRRIN